jgi:hypothetical protein
MEEENCEKKYIANCGFFGQWANELCAPFYRKKLI